MTTPGFGAFCNAVARAMAEVRKQHCQPPHYHPAETQRGAIHSDDRIEVCRAIDAYLAGGGT